MADYKEMYFVMMRASEKAMRILIDAQRACEEKIISKSDLIDISDIKKEMDKE